MNEPEDGVRICHDCGDVIDATQEMLSMGLFEVPLCVECIAEMTPDDDEEA